ncbi:MAG: C40 family peptidase [Bacteroidales bacterium]|nr:C40 family peptidase [Bacteroidales bacterium]
MVKVGKIFVTLFITSVLLNSCNVVRNIFNTDLEDEDFYVTEDFEGQRTYRKTPSKKTNKATSPSKTPNGKMGVTVTDKDNAKLYTEIEKWYGTPYKYGGCSTSGIDCSCFVMNIFSAVYGIDLSRRSSDMMKDITIVSRDQLREGDIIFFANNKTDISHVGIYLKEDMFAHSSSSKGVTISKLSEKYWDTRFYKAGRHSKVTTKW